MTMNSRKTLEKKQLKSLFWRSFTTSHAWHYERQQHMSFEFAMIPVINKLYDKEEDRIDAYKRHMEFYNCQTAMQPFICGVAAAMEEENANNEEFDTSSISAMKVALMGPLAGIGDTIGWAMIPTIFGSIAASMGMQGNPLGIFLWAAFTFAFLAVRILEVEWGYNMGINVVTKLGKQITVFTEACSVLGLTVVGSLISSVVKLQTGITYTNGDVTMKVQELLDGVMPSLLPVAAVALIYYFMNKKKVKMTHMILIIIILSWIGAACGIFTA